VLNIENLFAPEGGPVLTSGEAPADVLKLLYNLIMHLVGFYAVAILTSFLTRGVERARAELRATHLDLSYLEGLYGDVIESMSSGLLITDTEGMIISINQTGEEILGRSQKDLEGTPIAEAGIFTPEEWERLRRRSGTAPMRDELRYRRDDGEEIVFGYSLSRFLDKEKSWRGYLLIFQDLTDWRALEEKVRQQDRMAAIGEMASKIAHEVGNPLASISGSVQMLAGRESDPQGQKLLEIILKESRRLDRTVKSFLEFAVLPERQPAEVDVAALLAEGVELLLNSEEVRPGHRLVADLVPDSVTLFADPDQIGQVFWNLARNAIQAMPDGGELRVVGRLDGDRYRIEFRDTGNGMTAEERERLFLPFKSFFGRSLGLGMPIVSRIVEMHGGEIRVDSQPGRGTTITVELPTHPPAPESEEVVTDAAIVGR
jgi:two-component system sensor histidine kinase PilS (NtrC family)